MKLFINLPFTLFAVQPLKTGLQWVHVNYDQVIPKNAFQGGVGAYGEPQYVCKAIHDDRSIPGGVENGSCCIIWCSTPYQKSDYQVQFDVALRD